ncbi:MAG: hypothetical protein CMJ64_29985 [Planctomycetaceae bacterium]|nr:hypothetical protein [Planctomycetaceae bacterium]
MTRSSILVPLLSVSLILLLLLPPVSQLSIVTAQPAAEPISTAPFSLAYIPRDAIAVIAARPAVLMQRPALATLRDTVDGLSKSMLNVPLTPADVTQSAMVLLADDRTVSAAFIVRFASTDVAREFLAGADVGTAVTFSGQVYQRQPNGWCSFKPDARTLVLSPDKVALRRCIAAGKTGATTTKWAETWRGVASRDSAVLVNTSMLRGPLGDYVGARIQKLQPNAGRGGFATPPLTYRLAPLWQQSEHVVAELRVSDAVELRLVSQSASVDEAKQVHSALLTAVSVARNALSMARVSVARSDDATVAAMLQPIDLVDELLEDARIVRQETQLGAVVHATPEATRRLTKLAAPALLAGRAAGLRTRSLNNLKQIALAMHNYHDTYKRFPAATQLGPKDTPRSWRVTLLPWLEQQALYDEYRQDEPWDSENNQRVLAKMPDVFRCPMDTAGSTATSYFTFVSPRQERGRRPVAAFEENVGLSFRDFIDGTSNIILAVETKKPGTPWTKPEDLPFTEDRPLPKLGGWYPGGFNLALCDGSARFVTDQIDEATLRRLIMRNDGNPVQLPAR